MHTHMHMHHIHMHHMHGAGGAMRGQRSVFTPCGVVKAGSPRPPTLPPSRMCRCVAAAAARSRAATTRRLSRRSYAWSSSTSCSYRWPSAGSDRREIARSPTPSTSPPSRLLACPSTHAVHHAWIRDRGPRPLTGGPLTFTPGRVYPRHGHALFDAPRPNQNFVNQATVLGKIDEAIAVPNAVRPRAAGGGDGPGARPRVAHVPATCMRMRLPYMHVHSICRPRACRMHARTGAQDAGDAAAKDARWRGGGLSQAPPVRSRRPGRARVVPNPDRAVVHQAAHVAPALRPSRTLVTGPRGAAVPRQRLRPHHRPQRRAAAAQGRPHRRPGARVLPRGAVRRAGARARPRRIDVRYGRGRGGAREMRRGQVWGPRRHEHDGQVPGWDGAQRDRQGE